MNGPSLQDVADKVDDVARLLTRQSATLAQLADAPAGSAVSGAPDVALLVELHALRLDALACADTARSRRERAAFTALAGGLERLLAGRGGTVVTPVAGAEFDGRSMEAVEVERGDDPALDRTVAAVLTPGLAVAGRTVRPARVTVFRVR